MKHRLFGRCFFCLPFVNHAADDTTIGAWFDRVPNSAILDQRLFWGMLLMILVVKGAGWLSFDHAFQVDTH